MANHPTTTRRVRTVLFCLLALAGAFCTAAPEAAPKAAPRPGPVEQAVARIVCQLMGRNHYNRQRLDDQISAELFDTYFDRLDNTRSYFLAGDLEEFASYRNILDDLLQQGNVDFAYDVYARFLQRARERLEFTRRRLGEDFDFSQNEEILLDRSKEPRCKTVAELDEVWRQRLKNKLLTYELMRPGDVLDDPEGAAPVLLEPDPEAEAAPGQLQQQETAANPAAAQPAFTQKTPRERTLQLYERSLAQLEENDAISILEIFLNTLTHIYDPHSAYMAPSTEEDFDIQMKLSLEGIGAVLSTEDSYVKVNSIVPGGPADLEGRLKAGDRIIAVAQDGGEAVDVIDMPLRKVVRMIRGAKGTRVHLLVLDGTKSLGSVPVTISIVRDEVKLTDQEASSRMIETNPDGERLAKDTAAAGQSMKLALVTLPSFYSDFGARRNGDNEFTSSTKDVSRLVAEARAQNADGILLDLRGNGGGSLEEAISLTGIFLPAGPVVQVRDADRRVRVRNQEDNPDSYAGPLIVLVDRLSASASEIVAAALQDHRRALIVGDRRTHGKGTVQTVYPLANVFRSSSLFKDRKPGALKFTIAQFYRCNGGSTQSKGVVPDVIFPSFWDHMEIGEADLPHAMAWNQINPLDFKPGQDITPFIPTLIQRSWKRTEVSPEHRERTQKIKEFEIRRQRKTITLNREARQLLQKEDEEWAEALRRLNTRRRTRQAPAGSAEKPTVAAAAKTAPEDTPDPVLDEALRIMADMVGLYAGRTLAVPPAGEVAGTATASHGAPAEPAGNTAAGAPELPAR